MAVQQLTSESIPIHHGNRIGKLMDVLVVLAAITQVIFWRIPLFGVSPLADADIYMYISRCITKGLMPYRDIVDNKPPFQYFSGAFFIEIFHNPIIAFWVQEVFYVSLAAIVVYYLLRKALDRFSAFFLASLYIFCLNVSYFHWYFCVGYMEYTLDFWVISAYGLLLWREDSWKRAALAGICVSAAVLTRQTGIFCVLPIWIWLAVSRQYRSMLAHFCVIAFLAAAFVVTMYFYGLFSDFWYWVITWNKYIAPHVHTTTLAQSLANGRHKPILFLLAFIPLLFYLAPCGFRQFKMRYMVVLLWGMGSLAAIILCGYHLAAHYFVNLIAPMILSIGYGWAGKKGIQRNYSAYLVAGVSAGLFLLLLAQPLYAYTKRSINSIHLVKSGHGHALSLQRADLTEYIRKKEPNPGEKPFYIWARDKRVTTLATDTGGWIPGKIPEPHIFLDYFHPRQEAMKAEWIKNFTETKPKYLVVPNDRSLYQDYPDELYGFLQENYILCKKFTANNLYIHKSMASSCNGAEAKGAVYHWTEVAMLKTGSPGLEYMDGNWKVHKGFSFTVHPRPNSRARLRMKIPPVQSGVEVSFEAIPQLGKGLHTQKVVLYANAKMVASWDMTVRKYQTYQAMIPADIMQKAGDELVLEWEVPTARSARELEVAPDNGKFGLALHFVTLNPVP